MPSSRPSTCPQRVDAPLTSSATFLVLSLTPSDYAIRTVRETLASLSDITKNIAIRDATASLAVTAGIGAHAWDALSAGTDLKKPAELHPFREVKGQKHTAPSTPGDLLFHIRANRRDLCFETERQLLSKLGESVKVEDCTVGFRYFDARDLLGFVDGTANPVEADDLTEATVVAAEEDAAAEGGTYVVVQKYVHDMPAWQVLSTESQEAVIGRTKWDNVELDDGPDDGQKAHKTLANVEDEDGEEAEILRDNMPFGSPGKGEFGTYFIGYSRRLWVIERMLERMFVGDPPGMHDRLLDYSTALTGGVFYVPPGRVLERFDVE
jgi:porphyrinogen peroxidase